MVGWAALAQLCQSTWTRRATSALNMLWREGSVVGTDAYTWRTIEEILEEQLRERPPALVVAAIREAPTTCRVMSEVAKFVEDRPKAAELVNGLINSYRRRDSHSIARINDRRPWC